MYTKEEVLSLLSEPNGSQNIEIEPAWDGAWELVLEENAAALSFFVRAAKQERYARALNDMLKDRSLLHRLLLSREPKVRKNAARLAGALRDPRDVPVLIQALTNETARFARPSQILALGAMQTKEAETALLRYEVEPARDREEEKHAREEREALSAARASYVTTPRHPFTGFPEGLPIELRCAPSMEEALLSELAAAGKDARTTQSAGADIQSRSAGADARTAQSAGADTQSRSACKNARSPSAFTDVRRIGSGRVALRLNAYPLLQNVRTWRELLIPVAGKIPFDGEKIGTAAGPFLLRLMKKCHEGRPPYAYRIEVRGKDVRRGPMARAIAGAVEQSVPDGQLVNVPSAYEAELRVEPRGSFCGVWVRLYTAPDRRFAYRKGTVAASIHPSTAAGVVRLAAPFLKPGARVLDPCCGSGTMLIERALYSPCRELTGIDIFRQAVEIARKNVKAAGLAAEFIAKDCLKYEARGRYDEVIGNLPFGNRVGTHAGNEKLYRALLDKITEWLKEGGIAVLYTQELKLLSDEIMKRRQALRLLRHVRTEAGGLEPGIFILQRTNGFA